MGRRLIFGSAHHAAISAILGNCLPAAGALAPSVGSAARQPGASQRGVTLLARAHSRVRLRGGSSFLMASMMRRQLSLMATIC